MQISEVAPAGAAKSIPPPKRFSGQAAELRPVSAPASALMIPGQAAGATRPAQEPSRALPGAIDATSLPPASAETEASKPTAVKPPAHATLDASLIPGRSIDPIDLANVLKLAGARDLDIAIAKQRVNAALADMQQAYAMWLPSLFLGPTWYRADGQVQTITGQVENVARIARSSSEAWLLRRPPATRRPRPEPAILL